MRGTKLLIATSILAGFFMSYSKWDTLSMGLYNWLFATISAIIVIYGFYLISKKIADSFGISIEAVSYDISKSHKKWDYKREKWVVKERKVPLGFIIMIIFGIVTSGYIFPITSFSFNFSQIETKRVGRGEEITFSERIKIVSYSIIVLWIIFSTIKYFFGMNPAISAIIAYMYHALALLTFTVVIPWDFLLSYVVLEKLSADYTTMSFGDLMLFSETPYYKGLIIALILLPILSLVLDPISMLIISYIIGFYVWIREKYQSWR